MIEGMPELPQAPDGLAPQPSPDDASAQDNSGTGWLAWLAAIAALSAAIAASVFFFRRRNAAPLVIEPPLPPERVRETQPEPPAADKVPEDEALAEQQTPEVPPAAPVYGAVAGDQDMLTFEVEATKLTRSVMAARVAYLLRITNGTSAALEQVEICGDLIAARNGSPVTEQVAQAESMLDRRHLIERIDPGETQFHMGELVFQLAGAEPIMQGRTPLLVPLMRWIVRRESGPTLVETHVIGLKPEAPATRLQPFRLDIPPQSFDQIGNRPVG